LIVVDASAVIELLLNTADGDAIADRLFEPAEALAAPHLLDVEVLQVLRRYFLAGEIKSKRGQQAIEDLGDLPITRYPHDLFLRRIWDLRQNITAYDAVYVALAEALGATLLTRDEQLAAAPGLKATIEVI
jgi:predicted nucleic acid-binding protein